MRVATFFHRGGQILGIVVPKRWDQSKLRRIDTDVVLKVIATEVVGQVKGL